MMQLQKKIGLIEGIALVTGGVIGMGIYVMIASITVKAGAAVWAAISLALMISLAGVVPLMQISSALPIAGGGYFYCSRLLHPFAGTLVSYWAILGGASSTCVVAVGLGSYLKPFMPFEASPHLTAGILVIGFYILYLFGLKLVTWLQIVMSAQLILALIFYVWGITSQTPVTVGFDLPNGAGGLIMAVILAFNVCIGFQIITEMGEEMRDARRNIPLSLLLGGISVLVIYLGVGLAYLAAVGDRAEAFSKMNAPLVESARIFLPAWMLTFIGIGAVSAGLTSFNAAAITLPRELYAQARDGIIPRFFEKLNPVSNSPTRAVTLFFFVVAILLVAGSQLFSEVNKSIDFYGFTAACGVMMLTVFVSIASLRLPKIFPEQYQNAYFKVSKGWLRFFVTASILSSIGLVLLLFMESTLIFYIYAGYTFVVSAYYLLRQQWMRKKGLPMGEVFQPYKKN